MDVPKVFESEYRFCLVMWENEAKTMSELAKLCREKIGWSRTTTYTVIKRLEERGVLKREGSEIFPLYTKEEIQISEVDELIEKKFEGNLPAFIAAFSKSRKLSKKDIEDIRRLIDEAGE
ncbi:MAG: BlaI/MecI/CopY family transcriptional regulator [Clostridia bacterium]|nr:BlaI/MecI/CopY family transcriptional regulator [Clostridia bacterium]